jgi:uncharacterized protein YggT (Ycf19 family)
MLSLLIIILYYVCKAYEYIFWAYIILSYFPISENNIFIRIIRGICEPLYRALLRVLPPLRISMIDFSPIYVFLFLWIVEFILQRLALVAR